MDIRARYATAFQNCLSSLEKHPLPDEDTSTNPLLLVPPEGYTDSRLKVMYFGQETNDWEVRTYHPNYLWRFGLPDVCEAIIAKIHRPRFKGPSIRETTPEALTGAGTP